MKWYTDESLCHNYTSFLSIYLNAEYAIYWWSLNRISLKIKLFQKRQKICVWPPRIEFKSNYKLIYSYATTPDSRWMKLRKSFSLSLYIAYKQNKNSYKYWKCETKLFDIFCMCKLATLMSSHHDDNCQTDKRINSWIT